MTKRTLKKVAETVAETRNEKVELPPITKPNWDFVVTTGSTRLDLIISGGRLRYGGIPCGIMVEFFGSPGGGKTALLASIAAAVQRMKGTARIYDPEGRLDDEYSKFYGLDLKKCAKYSRPDTVREIFDNGILKWNTYGDPDKTPSMIGCDGAAALSTEMEMGGEDKMSMKRAKDFRTGCRKSARIISGKNKLLVWTNQLIDNVGAIGYAPKTITPGGHAIPFFSSLRCRVTQIQKLSNEKTLGAIRKNMGIDAKSDAKISNIYAIRSHIKVEKSSVDEPFRECDITLRFNYGIDDIRDNLEYLKYIMGNEDYNFFKMGNRGWGTISSACKSVEDAGLEKELKDKVVDVWNQVNKSFKEERKPRVFV